MSKFFIRLKRFFLTTALGGLVILLPIFIFISLMKLVFDLIRNIVAPLSKLIGLEHATNELLVDLLAVAIVIIGCFLVGLFTRTSLGKGIVPGIECIVDQQHSFLWYYSGYRTTIYWR